jgi:hypothetical protein
MSLKDKVELVASQLDVAEMRGEEIAEEKFSGDTRVGRAAQAGTVLSVVTVATIAIIGILIYSQVSSSLPNPSNNKLDNASGNVTDGFADAMNLLPVVFVVLVAALVIAVVQRFRG